MVTWWKCRRDKDLGYIRHPPLAKCYRRSPIPSSSSCLLLLLLLLLGGFFSPLTSLLLPILPPWYSLLSISSLLSTPSQLSLVLRRQSSSNSILLKFRVIWGSFKIMYIPEVSLLHPWQDFLQNTCLGRLWHAVWIKAGNVYFLYPRNRQGLRTCPGIGKSYKELIRFFCFFPVRLIVESILSERGYIDESVFPDLLSCLLSLGVSELEMQASWTERRFHISRHTCRAQRFKKVVTDTLFALHFMPILWISYTSVWSPHLDLNYLSSCHGTGLCTPLHCLLYFSESAVDRNERSWRLKRIFYPETLLDGRREPPLWKSSRTSPWWARQLRKILVVLRDLAVQNAVSLLLRVSETAELNRVDADLAA